MVVSQKKLLKVLVKNNGNQSKTAKQLGVTQTVVSNCVNRNPHIKKAILNAREK